VRSDNAATLSLVMEALATDTDPEYRCARQDLAGLYA
jgi:hypothetical protein